MDFSILYTRISLWILLTRTPFFRKENLDTADAARQYSNLGAPLASRPAPRFHCCGLTGETEVQGMGTGFRGPTLGLSRQNAGIHVLLAKLRTLVRTQRGSLSGSYRNVSLPSFRRAWTWLYLAPKIQGPMPGKQQLDAPALLESHEGIHLCEELREYIRAPQTQPCY